MAKKIRPNLKKALKKVDDAPDELFGNIDVDLFSLPCLVRPKKEKITANFDADLLNEIRVFAEKYDVSYTTLMNEVLRKVFIEKKKVS